ncbi:MAG: RMD1 family protein [Deltaproteobacteria bacterium]|nr:RMD1 family protein [Deltaproteobacteria bacterium]
MTATVFHGATTVKARALYLGERIDVRALEATSRITPVLPLAIQAGEHGACVLFRYGVVVFFHVSPLEEVGFIASLKKFIGDGFPKPELEEIEIRVVPDRNDGSQDIVEGNVLTVSELSVERVQLIAEILARTVALARYESVVKESWSAIENWAQALQQGRSENALAKQLLKNLGSTIVIQSSMTGRIEIDDKPEILWERADLERIYLRLEDEYELKERDKALERKLALISSTAEMMLNLVDNRHAHRLEWYIIGLIVLEIVISLTTIAFGASH